jgi:hypothetical protein
MKGNEAVGSEIKTKIVTQSFILPRQKYKKQEENRQQLALLFNLLKIQAGMVTNNLTWDQRGQDMQTLLVTIVMEMIPKQCNNSKV